MSDSKSISIFWIFSIVSAVLGIAGQLTFLYCDWNYAQVQTSIAPTNTSLLENSEYNCLNKVYECINDRLDGADVWFSHAKWAFLESTESYRIHHTVIEGENRKLLFKVSLKVTSLLSKDELYNYFASGPGMRMLYPVREVCNHRHLVSSLHTMRISTLKCSEC